jgi:hypothetical protein
MFYVELLRARNTLAITVGGLLLLAGVAISTLVLWPSHLHVTSYAAQTAFDVIGWIAALVTAIVATILGSSLACENCEHLEIAWTKPISRTMYAAGLFLVDLACLALVFIAAVGITYSVVSLYVGGPVHVPFDASNAWRTARFALFPVSMFGLAQALTSGTRGAWAGGMVGAMWPVAELLSIVAARPLNAVWHKIFAVINLVNPLGYFPFWEFDDTEGSALREFFGYGLTTDTLALAAIAILGVAIAMVRWRRMEA